MFLIKEKLSIWKKFNIFYYIKQIIKFVDVNKLKRLLTPLPANSYIQIYQLPQAVEISRERSKDTLSKIIKTFAQIDTELSESIYNQKILNIRNNFFTYKFGVIFDMRKTRIANSVTRNTFKEMANIIDIFPTIQITVIFPDMEKLKNNDSMYYEPMQNFKNELSDLIEEKCVVGMLIMESNHIGKNIYYEYIKEY